MKQKIVIKVQKNCDKCPSKALMIASSAPGVISVALEGKERDRVVVTGERVDAATLTSSLRKKIGFASLESVEELKEKADKKTEANQKVETKNGNKNSSEPNPTPSMANDNQQPNRIQIYKVVYDSNPPTCTML